MKKALATIMGLAFAVSAMAQYLIYDYNVSFKRLDAQFTKISYEFGKYDGKSKDFTGYFDSFKTASDKLVGSLVIDSCEACAGEWTDFGTASYSVAEDDAASAFAVADGNNEETSMLFVYRNGDNLSKNPYLASSDYEDVDGKLLWALDAKIDGAMFGKNAAVRLATGDATDCRDEVDDDLEGTPTSLKAAKEAYAVLTYDVPALYGDGIVPPVKGLNPDDDCVEPIPYGFLGYLCLSGDVSNAGFGSTTIVTTKGSTTVGFCGSKVKEGASCIAINKISGSTIGYFNYSGLCNGAALFDVCSKKNGRAAAPMCGTFTLKLNAAQSKKATSEEAVEEILEKKYQKFYLVDDAE